MKRVRMLSLLFAIVVLCLSGCGKKPDIGLLQSRSAGLLPAGCWYTEGKEEWEEGYLSPPLLSSLLGCEEWGAEKYAVFLSASDRELGEIVLVTCYTEAESTRVASLCAARLAFLRKNTPPPLSAVLEDAFVWTGGRTVVYSASAANAFLRAAVRELG